ncbi:MAG TPA: transposase [Burkholderiales bacterium]|nr:transposase [Burkholderiales bacterium]
MARHPRLILPHVALHVRQRGNDGQDCFREETDRLVYLSNLAHFCKQLRCSLHAYCLMTNHVHLLLTPSGEHACALLMQNIGRCYVGYFNRRYHRTGTLWEGRFRSCLVESADYVLGCHRYIESNPVRARMVRSAAEYRWSSHAGNSGGKVDALLTPHMEYLALSEREIQRHRAYAGLFQQVDDVAFLAALREATEGGYPLVGDALKSRLELTGSRVQRGKPGPRAKPLGGAQSVNAELSFTDE